MKNSHKIQSEAEANVFGGGLPDLAEVLCFRNALFPVSLLEFLDGNKILTRLCGSEDCGRREKAISGR